jgi:4-hydroxybenzoate polyprenyltransferase
MAVNSIPMLIGIIACFVIIGITIYYENKDKNDDTENNA